LRAHQRLESFGIHRIAPQEAFAALDALLALRAGQPAVCKVDWKTLANVDPQVARSPFLAAFTGAFLKELEYGVQCGAPENAHDRVHEIVAAVLRQPAGEIKQNVPLTNLGLDSLMAMEIKNRILAETAVNISIAQFLTGASISSLVEWVGTALQLRQITSAQADSTRDVAEDEQFTL
jgi:acyl carrier protein